MRSNVVKMEIPPKTIKKRYKNHTVTMTYHPETKTILWEVEKTFTVCLDGIADTEKEAMIEAQKVIDQIVEN